MAQAVPDTENVDQLREQLEATLSKLQASLKYWQIWEAEYLGFIEELELLNHDPSPEDMVQVGISYGGDVVDEKEIRSIVNINKIPRKRAQVIQVLTARAETGRSSAETVQKQITKAEQQLDEVLMVARPSVKNEEGDDLMEIMEDLDEEGNVISSKVESFEKNINHINNILKERSKANSANNTVPNSIETSTTEKSTTPSNPSQIVTSTKSPHGEDASIKREVTLVSAASTKRIDVEDVIDPTTIEPDIEAIGSDSEIDELEAQREMRQYMQDLGPVVASLDLISDDEDWPDEDEDGDEAEENIYGMNSIADEISEDYIKEMEALMKKHSLNTYGATPTPIIKQENKEVKSPKMKGVRFADNLDVAPVPKPATVSAPTTTRKPPSNSAPLSHTIVERTSTQKPFVAQPPGRVSRFKAAKQNTQDGEQTRASHRDKLADNTPEQDNFRNELKLYRERMKAPTSQMNRGDFKESILEEDEGIVEDLPKMSKFKARKLGLLDEDSDEY